MSLATRAAHVTPAIWLRVSIAVALATIGLKTAAWWLTGSVGLLSDAMESGVNLASAAFGLAMVRLAAQPPDREHPYGHHKAEYFASAFEGLAIVAAALAIGWAAVDRILHPQPIAQVGAGLALSVAASALNGALAWAMLQSARRHRSMALEGDARHLLTDVWTSAGVVLGIGLVAATGWGWVDPLVALGVAANILREGFQLARRSAHGLMDKRVDRVTLARIDGVLAGFSHPAIRFDHVTTRRSGTRAYVDLHMHMPGDWTLRRAAALRVSVEQALMGAVPGLRASIQLLPQDMEAHVEDGRDPL
jgi:cation diffusion facilitator family transporter